MVELPVKTRAIVVRKAIDAAESPWPFAACIEDLPLRKPMQDEVVVKMSAAAFNHKELWIRRGKYPGIEVGAVYGTDGAGIVIASGRLSDPMIGKRVFLVPFRGWESDPRAPETRFATIGGGSCTPGTFAEYVVVERDKIVETPEHMDDVHAAAWPAAGTTAWRVVMVNAQVKKGDNVLITGIGGGVALVAMQLCLAIGAHVYVTSGTQSKLDKAMSMGAAGGVSYRERDWEKKIRSLMNTRGESAMIDQIIDSYGGNIMIEAEKILRKGGCVVCYGMTSESEVRVTMRQILSNQRLIGSTAGSYQDLKDATAFISEHRIAPMVSHTVRGLASIDEAFKILERGEHFGKVVLRMDEMPASTKL